MRQHVYDLLRTKIQAPGAKGLFGIAVEQKAAKRSQGHDVRPNLISLLYVTTIAKILRAEYRPSGLN